MVVGVDQYKRIRKMAAEGGLSQSVYCRLKTDNRRKKGLQKNKQQAKPKGTASFSYFCGEGGVTFSLSIDTLLYCSFFLKLDVFRYLLSPTQTQS